jgi:hypothetical protein
MGGLIENVAQDFPLFKKFGGDFEQIARHVEETSVKIRMPIDSRLWLEQPPSSTYPAVIAVKGVGLQGADLEDLYLRRVREGFLTERRALDTFASLLHLAKEIPGIDTHRLSADIESGTAERVFREDWQACRTPVPEARDTTECQGWTRYCFPTLILTNESGIYRILDIDHTYEDHLTALQELAHEIHRGIPPSIEALVDTYPSVATEEVSVVCEVSWETAEKALESLVHAGRMRRRPVGHFCLWERVH